MRMSASISSLFSRLETEFVGVDGADIRRVLGQSSRHRQDLSDGEVGCALSHVEVCRRIVDQELEFGVVVEDDVVLPKDFDSLVERLVRQLRPGEIISLYCPTWDKWGLTRHGQRESGRYAILQPRHPDTMRTTLALLIHKDAARRIASVNDPVIFRADDFGEMYRRGLVNYLGAVHPFPCSYFPFPSSIGYIKRPIVSKMTQIAGSVWPLSVFLRRRRLRLQNDRLRHMKVFDDEPHLPFPNPSYKVELPE